MLGGRVLARSPARELCCLLLSHRRLGRRENHYADAIWSHYPAKRSVCAVLRPQVLGPASHPFGRHPALAPPRVHMANRRVERSGAVLIGYLLTVLLVALAVVLGLGVSGYDAGSTISAAGLPPCTYEISPESESMPAPGGVFEVTLTTASGCSWTAESQSSWLTVVSANSGSGPGSIGISVAPNPDANSRTGSVVVAGQTLTVNQAASSASFSTVSIEGGISGLSGGCPNLTFAIDGPVEGVRTPAKTTIITGSATTFTGASCDDLQDGDKVLVTGSMGADGRVTAATVELRRH